jgi:hypothetical protein
MDVLRLPPFSGVIAHLGYPAYFGHYSRHLEDTRGGGHACTGFPTTVARFGSGGGGDYFVDRVSAGQSRRSLVHQRSCVTRSCVVAFDSISNICRGRVADVSASCSDWDYSGRCGRTKDTIAIETSVMIWLKDTCLPTSRFG